MINIISKEIIKCGGIENYLYTQQYKTLLRFLTCGSVDDGKSTLIGRLFYDTKNIYDDQLSNLHLDKNIFSSNKNKPNLALLVDGLQSERMQGITIDVAYRYFFTQKRKFVIIDAPGHEEYTKNMVIGASNSDLAILLVDARVGLRKQTQRHWFISVLMGIKCIIVAINKMDLVNYDQSVFENIYKQYLEFSNQLSVDLDIKFIPISALNGDNVVIPSKHMLWYEGPTLFDILENIKINTTVNLDNQKLRLPIQYVVRDCLDCRGYSGTIASGSLHVGQHIQVFPSGTVSYIKQILEFNKNRVNAITGEAITVTFTDDIDVSRGDIIVDAQELIHPTHNALVHVVWMQKKSLEIGQYFDVKVTTKIYRVQIKNILYKIDIHTFRHHKNSVLPYNGIGLVELLFEEKLILDRYRYYPVTGSMIFIDILTNETVGAGMVKSPVIQKSVLQNQKYSEFELALHSLIRLYFPHWKIGNLS